MLHHNTLENYGSSSEDRIPFTAWACKVNGGPLTLKPKQMPKVSVIVGSPNSESPKDIAMRMKKNRSRFIKSFTI